jgi:hypothetical protein
MDEFRNFCTTDFVLAGKAIDVRTGAAHPAPFDDRRSFSRLRQVPGKVFPALTAPDDDILKVFGVHVRLLCNGWLNPTPQLLRRQRNTTGEAAGASLPKSAWCSPSGSIGVTCLLYSPDFAQWKWEVLPGKMTTAPDGYAFDMSTSK